MKQKWLGVAAGFMMLPALAACAPETAQAPTDTAPAQPSPGLTQSPPAATAPTTDNRSIAELAATDNSLSTFNTAIEAAGLTEALQGQGPYTVFAPSDEAFAAIPAETRAQLLQPENREKLRQVLSYHVVSQNLPANQLQSGEVNTLAGQPLNVQVNQGTQQVSVNDASVTQPNLQASNGIVHVVDRVILPPDFTL
ncbi:fasciclin domain-containing protein [Pantanalinema rosaneae CENA516]|uniref:fasciclin domain-containing protein n=1 Tax=Pantanalinema rosaneae TaxID=1620701 RepID=UPI003D6F22DA